MYEETPRGIGPIVASIIIIVLIIVAGLYFAREKLSYTTEENQNETAETTPPPTETADTVDSISADLEASLQAAVDSSDVTNTDEEFE